MALQRPPACLMPELDGYAMPKILIPRRTRWRNPCAAQRS